MENSSKDENSRPPPEYLFTGQEATMRIGHGTTDWFKIGKGIYQGCILSLAYLTCMQIKKQQLELDMKQTTGSTLEKEFIKTVYCHPIYLTYMQRTS